MCHHACSVKRGTLASAHRGSIYYIEKSKNKKYYDKTDGKIAQPRKINKVKTCNVTKKNACIEVYIDEITVSQAQDSESNINQTFFFLSFFPQNVAIAHNPNSQQIRNQVFSTSTTNIQFQVKMV